MVTDQQLPAFEGSAVFGPGSVHYLRATSPQNSLARQHPALVAAPVSAEEVSWCVRYAARRGLTVVAQATGHGATGELGEDILLLDTSGLNQIAIDPRRRTARVGAGCTWGAVNAEAPKAGLLGRAGSAPSVGITGFSFGAGAGWLTRPHGLASSALAVVDYVDGRGAIGRATDDAEDDLDRDVMWACHPPRRPRPSAWQLHAARRRRPEGRRPKPARGGIPPDDGRGGAGRHRAGGRLLVRRPRAHT